MIIYHGITTWHVLECWIHKLEKYKDESAVLILPDFILDKFPNIVEEFPKHIFKIIIVKYRKLNYKQKTELFEKNLENIIDQSGINELLDDAREIYVAGAQYMFSHYLIKKNIKFNFIEEAPGRLTTSEVVEENLKKINEIQYKIALEDGMFVGNSENVDKIICNVSAQKNGCYLPNNIEDFNVVDCLLKLKESELKLVKSYFRVSNYELEKNSIILLTQHFANLNMMNYVEQALMYQMTIDYFVNSTQKLYVKPHPDDLMNYKSELQKCDVIKGRFPSELLHVLSKNQQVELLTINSSSVLNLKKYYKKIVSFNEEYLRTFIYNHQYYLVSQIIKMINVKEISLIGINKEQLENLIDIVDDKKVTIYDSDEGKGKLYFISGEDTEELNSINKDDHTIYVFLEPSSWYIFAENKENCIKNGLCKQIKLRASNEENEEGSFYLYIYCENKKIRKEIAGMHYAKNLINTGIETTVPKMTDKDMEIAVLKGILKATEKRLEAYIKKENDNMHEKK